MTKTIAIVGGTGAQGGGVANVMFKTPGWKLRIITRNADSDKAKELASKGAEVVSANADDEESLVKAFEGAHAIFAVTNFWEHLFTGKSQDESGVIEVEQALKLARAAAKTSTLEHYIWSTLPSAKKTTNGKVTCAHIDYKAEVDDKIRSEMPELAKKTTFLYFGYYATNMVYLPLLKPMEVPGSYGKWVQIVSTAPTTAIPVTGDMTVNPGIWVRQILANPDKSKGKYTTVATETVTLGDMLNIWSEVTGRQGIYIQCSRKDYENLWGVAGDEITDQWDWAQIVSDWTAHVDYVSKEELGIKPEETPGLKATLESLKSLM